MSNPVPMKDIHEPFDAKMGEGITLKPYSPFTTITTGEAMLFNMNSFQDRVEGFSHNIIIVNKTNRKLQFYGTAEGLHGFDADGKGSWVCCNEVIIQINERPEPKKSLWKRFLECLKLRYLISRK